jgi:hypothetical protein
VESAQLTGKVELMSSSPQSSESPSPDTRTPSGDSPDVPATPSGDYVDGVPTFDFVRDKIEGRYATAAGSIELAEESAAGRTAAQQQEDRDAKARERLEEIRRSLGED